MEKIQQKTKYERRLEENKIRVEREKNIREIETKLKHAEDLLAVMPISGDSYEESIELRGERQLVSETISELSEMLEDEKTALDNLGLNYPEPDNGPDFLTNEI